MRARAEMGARNLLRLFAPAGWIGVAAALATGLLLLAWGWWLLSEPGRQRAVAVRVEAGRVMAQADAAASQKAAEAVADLGDRNLERADIGRENQDDINRQPGASLPVDRGVHDATLRSLCRRAAHRDAAQCVRLRQASAAQPAR